MAAGVALILMAAESSGSAPLDGAQGPQMSEGQPMGLSISRAVLTEDFRHLRTSRGTHRLWDLGNGSDAFIERRGDLGQVQPTHMQIDGRRSGGFMTQKQLDMVETRSGFNQMSGKAVPQGMHAGRFGDPGPFFGLIEELLDRIDGDVDLGLRPRK